MKDALAAEIDKDYNQLDTATVTCHPSPDQEDPLNNLGLPASDMHTWEAQGMPQHLQFVHAQVIPHLPHLHHTQHTFSLQLHLLQLHAVFTIYHPKLHSIAVNIVPYRAAFPEGSYCLC